VRLRVLLAVWGLVVAVLCVILMMNYGQSDPYGFNAGSPTILFTVPFGLAATGLAGWIGFHIARSQRPRRDCVGWLAVAAVSLGVGLLYGVAFVRGSWHFVGFTQIGGSSVWLSWWAKVDSALSVFGWWMLASLAAAMVGALIAGAITLIQRRKASRLSNEIAAIRA